MSIDFQRIQEDVSKTLQMVQQMHQWQNQPIIPIASAEEKPINVKETAEFLDKTEATVYGLVYERRIPFHKPDGTGKLYFFRSELIEWIKNGRKPTADELDEQARQQIASRINRRGQSKERKGGARS